MPTAYIALGSNLGDRLAFLRAAIDQLRRLPHSSLVAVSSFHETAPVDSPASAGPYLNAAASLETQLNPQDLMHALLAIELRLGRDRTQPQAKNAPRPIDLDLLLYDNAVLHALLPNGLILPHPRMHLRRFVLAPLAEIAPTIRHPTLALTVQQLLEGLPEPAKDHTCK